MRNPEIIKKMFAEVAPGYDRANSLLSAGIHHLWRSELVRWSGAKPGASVLDCATGTGDLAIEFKKKLGFASRVVGSDFCGEMLEKAPAKAAAAGLDISFREGDLMKLSEETASYDVASVSFGIRNVADPVVAISELARVVKPGGVVMILEFGQPRVPVLSGLFDFYSKHLLPKLGGLVTGHPEAYKYLQESSATFPCGDDFVRLLKESGHFSAVDYKSLSFGIAYLYKAQKRIA